MEKLSKEEKEQRTFAKREWNRLNKNRLLFKDNNLSNIKILADLSNEVNKNIHPLKPKK